MWSFVSVLLHVKCSSLIPMYQLVGNGPVNFVDFRVCNVYSIENNQVLDRLRLCNVQQVKNLIHSWEDEALLVQK